MGAGPTLTSHQIVMSLRLGRKIETPQIPNETAFEFVYDAMLKWVQEQLASNGECQPTSTGTVEQTRFTTVTREIIDVRLEMTRLEGYGRNNITAVRTVWLVPIPLGRATAG